MLRIFQSGECNGMFLKQANYQLELETAEIRSQGLQKYASLPLKGRFSEEPEAAVGSSGSSGGTKAGPPHPSVAPSEARLTALRLPGSSLRGYLIKAKH